MERCGVRRSIEKPRVEAPPRLQVIGFNVSAPMKAAPATSRGSLDMVSSPTASDNELPISPSQLSKPAASSPRSALQQLLLHQSLPSTSPTSSNHSLPPLKPCSSQDSKLGLLQPATSPPAAANQRRGSGGLLQPSTSPCPANQKWTSGIAKPQSPPSAYQRDSSSARLKSPVQSELTISDISANQSCGTSFFSSLGQSQYANSSISSGGSQLINQHNAKPAKAVIKENLNEAFSQVKKAGDDGNGETAHEAKGRWITSAKADHSAKSKKSSWLHNDGNDDDDHPSATERCKKNSWKGAQPIMDHSPGNEKSRKSSRSEEKSKKSSIFIMFVASSPAAPPDYHHHGHSAEHHASKTMDFLSSCHLCGCPLGQGQDVFMYSGDKAFCSMECRYEQIVLDERKERCPPPIIRSGASLVFHHTSVTAMATHHPTMINNPYFINTAAAA